MSLQTAAIGALESLTNNCPANQGAAVGMHLVVEITAALGRHGAVSTIQTHAPIILERMSRNVNIGHGRAAQYLSKQPPSKMSSFRSEKSFTSRFDAPAAFDEAGLKDKLSARSKTASFKGREGSSLERSLSNASSANVRTSESSPERAPTARSKTGASKTGDEQSTERVASLGSIPESSDTHQRTDAGSGTQPSAQVEIVHAGSVSPVKPNHKLRRIPSRRPTFTLLTYMPLEPALPDKRPQSSGTTEGMENSRGDNTDVGFLTRIANSRDVPYVQQMLRSHRMDAYVQHACLAAISACVCNDPQILKLARDREILEDVINAMVTHDRVGSIQEAACRAIKYLVADGAKLSGREDAMPAIALALRGFREAIPILCQCFLAMHNLVEGDEKSKNRCLGFGLLGTISMSIKMMGLSAPVVETSMKLLLELATSSVAMRLEQTFKEIHNLGLLREVELAALNYHNNAAITTITTQIMKLGRRHGHRTTVGGEGEHQEDGGGGGKTPQATDRGGLPYEEPSGISSSQTPRITTTGKGETPTAPDGEPPSSASPRRLLKKRRSTINKKKKKPAVVE